LISIYIQAHLPSSLFRKN